MTKLANPQRAEAVIKLGTTEFVARPSFSFIAEVEDHFNLPLANIIFDRLQTGNVRAVDIVAIIAAGIRGAGEVPDLGAIQEAIAETGTVEATQALVPLISNAFSGSNRLAKKK